MIIDELSAHIEEEVSFFIGKNDFIKKANIGGNTTKRRYLSACCLQMI